MSKNRSLEHQSRLDRKEEDYSIKINTFKEDDTLLPFELNTKNGCKRYSGKIRFGLFKGVWLLNYAYGCKNRVNKVSMIEILSKHKLFGVLF